MIHEFKFKLNLYNSVNQAELAAIDFATNWAKENKTICNIFSDSLASIETLKSANPRSEYVKKVKNQIRDAKGYVGLSWVKAHVGDPGNEQADLSAKQATVDGDNFNIPAPKSYLNSLFRQKIKSDWRNYWGEYRSHSAERVRTFGMGVDPRLLIIEISIVHFLTDHGPFPSYLHRFHVLDNPKCLCWSRVSDADHYVFQCSLTQEFHLPKPAEAHKQIWFQNLKRNAVAIGKLRAAFSISDKICDILKRRQNDT